MVRPYTKRTPEQRLALKTAALQRLQARYNRDEEALNEISKRMVKLNARIIPLKKSLEPKV